MSFERIIELYPWSLRVHTLIQEMNRLGGSIDSRLVSEEDIQLEFTLPLNGPTILTVRGVEYERGDAGDTIVITSDLHIHGPVEPLDPHIRARFVR